PKWKMGQNEKQSTYHLPHDLIDDIIMSQQIHDNITQIGILIPHLFFPGHSSFLEKKYLYRYYNKLKILFIFITYASRNKTTSDKHKNIDNVNLYPS
ncbi:hypothetical protein ACJX0J_006919, partial [Zea mays]